MKWIDKNIEAEKKTPTKGSNRVNKKKKNGGKNGEQKSTWYFPHGTNQYHRNQNQRQK